MLMLKIMSGEDKADSNTSKQFVMINITSFGFKFVRKDGKPFFQTLDDEFNIFYDIELEGNAYVMQDGKTIASFAYSDIKD